MKILFLEWYEVTDKTVQNCFKKADFSEIEDDDAVSDDPFASVKIPSLNSVFWAKPLKM